MDTYMNTKLSSKHENICEWSEQEQWDKIAEGEDYWWSLTVVYSEYMTASYLSYWLSIKIFYSTFIKLFFYLDRSKCSGEVLIPVDSYFVSLGTSIDPTLCLRLMWFWTVST